MSLDYADYPRIRERSRWLGRLWMIGDYGYHIGLLAAGFAFYGVVAALVGGLGGLVWPGNKYVIKYWRQLPLCVVTFPVGIGILLISAHLKSVAFRRSGILDEDPDVPDEAANSEPY